MASLQYDKANDSYRVFWMQNGRRRSKRFGNHKPRAKAFLIKLEHALLMKEDVFLDLTGLEREAIVLWRSFNTDLTLFEFIKKYKDAEISKYSSITLKDGLKSFIDSLPNNRRTQDKKIFLKSFIQELGTEMIVSKLSADMIKRYLRRYDNPITYNSYLSFIQTFVKFLGYKKIVEDIPRQQQKRAEIKIYSVDDIKKILSNVINKYPKHIGLISMLVFGGIRVSEIRFLKWEDINLDNNDDDEAILKDGKTGRRIIPISSQLKAFLKLVPARLRKGYIQECKNEIHFNEYYARLIRKIMPKDVKGIPNGFRKTWISYNVTASNLDLHKISSLVGNSPAVLRKNYYFPMRKDEASSFFSISTENLG